MRIFAYTSSASFFINVCIERILTSTTKKMKKKKNKEKKDKTTCIVEK